MARRRGDDQTLDLLEWQPPELVQRFDEQRVRGATLRSKIAKAIAASLKDCGRDRATVAMEMCAYLGERVTVATLNGYASEARADNAISFVRLIALVQVTGDMRLLQLAAEIFDHAVIEARYLAAVKDAMLADHIEQIKTKQKQARRAWKGGAR